MCSYHGASEEHGDVGHNKCIRMTPPCVSQGCMGGEWGRLRKRYVENTCSEADMGISIYMPT